MRRREQYITPEGITQARLKFYDELNAEGKLLVDFLAAKLEKGYKAKKYAKRGLGELGFRELAIITLERCWNGEIPVSFPVLMEVSHE